MLGEDSSYFERRVQKTARAMNEKLWDEEHSTYLDFDLTSNRLLEVYVAPNFVPLYAGIPEEEQARRMVDSLENTGFGLSDACPYARTSSVVAAAPMKCSPEMATTPYSVAPALTASTSLEYGA